jgi:hypothetical protein
MSTERSAASSTIPFIASPHTSLISIFFAVILASSLIEFNQLIFPPKLTSLSFWAILAAYYGALTTWLSFFSLAMKHHLQVTDTLLERLWLSSALTVVVAYLGLLYFAAKIPDSLFAYMWCWVVIFAGKWVTNYFRQRDAHIPHPLGIVAIFGSLALLIAIVYSILSLVFLPVPDAVNWAFVFIACANILVYRHT